MIFQFSSDSHLSGVHQLVFWYLNIDFTVTVKNV
jgi:hypothetical protein